MSFFKKNGNSAEEMKNWYQDRYSSVAIQRNFLLLFSVFTAGALLVCLIIIKNLQEGKASDPYLIEYDRISGLMTIVETKSKLEYTSQQAVKESMILQYIDKREAPKLSSIEEDMNFVRVSTAAKIYSTYLEEIGKNIRELKAFGNNAKYEIKVKSLQYMASNRVQVTITKNTIVNGKEEATMDYKITITFGFADIEMPIEDMRINPLGFQVSYYHISPVKTFQSVVVNNNENNKDNNKVQNETNNN